MIDLFFCYLRFLMVFPNSFETVDYNKGYRLDVYVGIDSDLFKINVYDIVRLQQDFESEIQNYVYYAVDPNLVIVKEVNQSEIILRLISFINKTILTGSDHLMRQ